MRRNLVVGNWKMNGSRSAAARLCAELVAGVARAGTAEVAVCPPYVSLTAAADALNGSGIGWGAQDLDVNENGAFTGQISAAMLVDAGCGYVIVGHSERRGMYFEDDALVGQKARVALAAGLRPIVCVGETLAQREAGQAEKVVTQQLDAVLSATPDDDFSRACVAYEPVWAIGTGQTATPDQAQAMHALIRARLGARDAELANSCRILYGGSMKPQNAAELIAQTDIDGGLIGGAALVGEDFLRICAAAGGTDA